MATTTQEWPQSGDEMNQARPDPVITFDHISDTDHPLYYRTGNKINNLFYSRLLIDGILIAGMLTALLFLAF